MNIDWQPCTKSCSEYQTDFPEGLILRAGRNFNHSTNGFSYWSIVKKNDKEIIFSTFSDKIRPESLDAAKRLAEIAAGYELWRRQQQMMSAFGIGVL